MNFGKTMHWLYAQNRYLWWFWKESYRGGETMRLASALSSGLGASFGQPGADWQTRSLEDPSSLTRRFLWSHEREAQEDYLKRLARSRYMRYAGYAVDVRTAGVVEGASLPKCKLDASWLEDTDGRGATYASLRSRWCTGSQVFGMMHVGGDVSLGGNPKTARRKPGLPRLYTISPMDLPLWSADPSGRFRYAVVRELAADTAPPPWKGGSGVGISATGPRYYYRTWTAEETCLFDEDGREVQWIDPEGRTVSGPQRNKFGRVPIETIYFRRNEEYPSEPVGQSWMEDPALVNLWHYNLLSLRDTVVTDTAFPFLAWPRPEGETQIPPEQELDIGTKQAIPFHGSAVPTWIQPSPDAVNTITGLTAEAVKAIRELAGLTIDSEASGQAHSAEALALMRANLDASFGEHARMMEDGERRVCVMACEIGGVSPEGAEVSYPQDYGQQEAGRRMEDITAALDQGLRNVPSAYALLLKNSMRTILPHLKSQDYDKVDAEIDAEANAAKKREEERVAREKKLAEAMEAAAKAQKTKEPEEPGEHAEHEGPKKPMPPMPPAEGAEGRVAA